jgi:hypothetical protein
MQKARSKLPLRCGKKGREVAEIMEITGLSREEVERIPV